MGITAWFVAAWAALALLALPAHALHEAGHNDFNLAAFCNPMGIIVENLRDVDARKVGLTRQDIVNAVNAVESRVRVARLFSAESPQYLYVNVNPVRNAFSIIIELHRRTENTGFGFPGFVSVWDAGTIGMHGGDGQYIMGSVSEQLDKFIAEYLRENQEWCDRRLEEKWPADAIMHRPDD